MEHSAASIALVSLMSGDLFPKRELIFVRWYRRVTKVRRLPVGPLMPVKHVRFGSFEVARKFAMELPGIFGQHIEINARAFYLFFGPRSDLRKISQRTSEDHLRLPMRKVAIGIGIVATGFWFFWHDAELPGVIAANLAIRPALTGTACCSAKRLEASAYSKRNEVLRNASNEVLATPRKTQPVVDTSQNANDEDVKVEFARHEIFRKVWEARRSSVYSELRLSPFQEVAIEKARQDFYEETDAYIAVVQSPDSGEAEASKAIKNLDEATEEYDAFVRTTLGREKFSILAYALREMNAAIETRSTAKFQFVSAW